LNEGLGLNPVLIGAQVLDFARPSQKSFSSPASEGPIGAWAKCTSGLPANAHYRNSIGLGLNPVLIGAQVLDFARPSQKSFSSPASEGPIGAWAKCTSGLPANAHYRNSIEA
jgi:hypothetical protein